MNRSRTTVEAAPPASLADLIERADRANGSVPAFIADTLREAIVLGVVKGGEQLRQSDVADAFGVSIIPVREAFQQLIAEGFVNGYRNKGVVVAETSIEEIRELFDLRVALEAILLKNAIPQMTRETLIQAKEFQSRLEAETDTTRWGHWNWMLHEALYLPAFRPRTLKVVANVNAHVDRLLRVQMTLSAGAKATGVEHHAIIDACERGEGDRAIDLLTRHIRRVESILLNFATHRDAEAANPRRETERKTTHGL